MKKIAIFLGDSNGSFPVPAVKGGAVQTLVEHLLVENSNNQKCEFTMFSFWNEEAEKEANKIKNTKFIWIKPSKIIKLLDRLLFEIISKIFKKKKAISFKSIFSLLYYIIVCSRKLKKSDFDVVVLENNVVISWIIKLAKYNKKYIYHFHNIPRSSARCLEVFENCDEYICVSNFLANELTKNDCAIGKIDSNKIKVVYNSIDTNLFKIQDEKKKKITRKKYNIKDNDKIILYVGRLSREKGIDKVVDAVKCLNENYKLYIVGNLLYKDGAAKSDPFYQELLQNTESIKEKVIFTGYVEQKELPDLYNIADVVVLPSMWDEPAGLTMIECLSCGSKLITTKSGGIPEYVKNNAIILEKDSNLVENISSNIHMLINDKDNNSGSYDEFSIKKYLENFIKEID